MWRQKFQKISGSGRSCGEVALCQLRTKSEQVGSMGGRWFRADFGRRLRPRVLSPTAVCLEDSMKCQENGRMRYTANISCLGLSLGQFLGEFGYFLQEVNDQFCIMQKQRVENRAGSSLATCSIGLQMCLWTTITTKTAAKTNLFLQFPLQENKKLKPLVTMLQKVHFCH